VLSSLGLAVRYLTILPLPGRRHAGVGDLGAAAAWFPVVGLGIGVILVAVGWLTSRVFPPLLAALLTVTCWKLITGGLHLDGLADCLDGIGGRDPEHRLAIMRDSRIGAMGAIGLILFLLLEITALSELPAAVRPHALLAAPVIARAMPALLGRLLPAARREGLGAAFQASLPRRAPPLALAVALAVAALALGGAGVVAVAVASGLCLLLARFFARRLGGMTGDVFGGSIEAAELAALLTVSAWVHAVP
jgi:adenosylcobinamide-GDP ribazoletransferase